MSDIYCICRKPQGGKWMIGCDFCDDWFHGSCIDMNEDKARLVIKFACPLCVKKGKLGVWKRKCRLQACIKPVETNSKYCSDAHGLEFMKSILADSTSTDNITTKKLLGVTAADLAKVTRDLTFQQFKEGVLSDEDLGSGSVSNLRDNNPKSDQSKQEQTEPSNQTDLLNRKKALELCKERTKKLNEALTAQSGKKRDVCGLDQRLLDERWKQPSFALDYDPENCGDFICMNERRKCLKHIGWHSIMVDEVNMEMEIQANGS